MDPLNNHPDRQGGLGQHERGNIRQRQAPGEARGNEDQWENVNGLREYLANGRGIVAYHLGRQVNQSVLGIIKGIILLLLFMLLCFIFGYESIPRMIALFFMIAAGLRYCWLRWYGKNVDLMINVNID